MKPLRAACLVLCALVVGACGSSVVVPPLPDSQLLGWVLDPRGNGVKRAALGDDAVTNDVGVAVGAVPATGSGWLRVDAPGFAPSWVAPYGERAGRRLYEARVTARDVTVLVEPGARVTLATSQATPRLVATFDDAFPGATLASLTWVDARHVDAAQAPHADGKFLSLRGAFALEATALDTGAAVGPVGGASIDVALRDDGALGNDVTLVRFEPVSGKWEGGVGACTRRDAQTVGCMVTGAGPLFGVFGPRGAGLLRSFHGARDLPGEGDYTDAKTSLDEALGDYFHDHPGGGGWKDLPDAVKDALEDWADAAEGLANANPNEASKGHVLRVAQQAVLLGADAIAARMMQLGTRIAEDVARDALEGDCTTRQRMLTALEQLIAFAGDAGLQEQLRQKINDVDTLCGVWTGTVEIKLPVLQQWPTAFEDLEKAAGAYLWTETDDVELRVDFKSGKVDGSLLAQLFFGELQYEAGSDAEKCAPLFLHTVKGTPYPSNATFKFEGKMRSLPEQDFELTLGQPARYGSPGNFQLENHDHVQAEQDEQCVTVLDQRYTALNGFGSFLIQGFQGNPPLTLQDLVDRAQVKGPWPYGYKLHGWASVPIDAPEAAYPVGATAEVTWTLWFYRQLPF